MWSHGENISIIPHVAPKPHLRGWKWFF